MRTRASLPRTPAGCRRARRGALAPKTDPIWWSDPSGTSRGVALPELRRTGAAGHAGILGQIDVLSLQCRSRSSESPTRTKGRTRHGIPQPSGSQSGGTARTGDEVVSRDLEALRQLEPPDAGRSRRREL